MPNSTGPCVLSQHVLVLVLVVLVLVLRARGVAGPSVLVLRAVTHQNLKNQKS
jgi:hypothetical protein